MLKGTQVLIGSEAKKYNEVIERFRQILKILDFQEIILPSIWDLGTFKDKLGQEKEDKMWVFKDKGDRDCCLIPEVTGIIQELWNNGWSKTMKKPAKFFYVQRCYRYDKPQLGRYREFTQVGIEILDGAHPSDYNLAIQALEMCLKPIADKCKLEESADRGISYYEDGKGFEVECLALGAQKQIAGGGRYREGIGWAIGVERYMLALD